MLDYQKYMIIEYGTMVGCSNEWWILDYRNTFAGFVGLMDIELRKQIIVEDWIMKLYNCGIGLSEFIIVESQD